MKQKDLKNLKKAIKELNSSTTVEWEDGSKDVFESDFEFTLEKRNGQLVIYDKKENYHIDYVENLNYELSALMYEFEFEKLIEESEDKIYNQLEEAVKKDLGKDYFLDWENSVVMVITK